MTPPRAASGSSANASAARAKRPTDPLYPHPNSGNVAPRLQLINESEEPIASLFYYVDYESMEDGTPEDLGRFRESIRVTIEHGHANDQGNIYPSVAY